MPRRFENMTTHNIRLHRGDIAWLQSVYPDIGAAAVIRTLIQRHRHEIETTGRPRPDAVTLTRRSHP